MLTPVLKLFCKDRIVVYLFVTISFVNIAAIVSADQKKDLAEQYRNQGYEEQLKGNLYEALSFYTKSVTLGGGDPVVLNDIGVIYEQIGLIKKAEDFYQQAAKVDPRYLPTYSNLGYLYLKTGRREKAFINFKKRYVSSEPGDPWGEKAKEEILKLHPELHDWVMSIEAKRLEKSVTQKAHDEFYEKLVKSNDIFKTGEQYFLAGDYPNAIREFDRALQFTPRNPKILEMKQKAKLEIMKSRVKDHYASAMQMLESGNVHSAKNEIQQMLTTIPGEPVINPNR